MDYEFLKKPVWVNWPNKPWLAFMLTLLYRILFDPLTTFNAQEYVVLLISCDCSHWHSWIHVETWHMLATEHCWQVPRMVGQMASSQSWGLLLLCYKFQLNSLIHPFHCLSHQSLLLLLPLCILKKILPALPLLQLSLHSLTSSSLVPNTLPGYCAPTGILSRWTSLCALRVLPLLLVLPMAAMTAISLANIQVMLPFPTFLVASRKYRKGNIPWIKSLC